MSTEDDSDKGMCILSFDNGGPGTYYQHLFVREYTKRLAIELRVDEGNVYLADHFDLMGGVGFGGFAAFLFGYLGMTADEALDTLLTIASAVFPYDLNGNTNPETNMQNLKAAIEDMLETRNIPLNTRMCDKSKPLANAKSLYAAMTANFSHPKIFRTYPHRGSSLNPTIVEALCATMASPSFFSPVKIGKPGREQTFIGGPLGANNPTRELLKEAGVAFGDNTRVAQVISLGAGWPGKLSLESPRITDVLRTLTADCEVVASELSTRLFNIDAYVRLNLEGGIESANMDDWSGLTVIEGKGRAYIEVPEVSHVIDESVQYLQNRIGTATLGQINQSSNIRLAIKVAPAVSQYHVVRLKAWGSMVHHLIDRPYPGQRIFVITGMGGCGKTQLVSYFLQEKGSQYSHAIFVDASSSSSVKADLQAWVQSLGLDHEHDVWEDARRILASGPFEGKWVLVLDSADDLRLDLVPFFPKCYSGTIIVTSRNRNVGDLANTYHLELGEMEVDEALSTLMRAARRRFPLPLEEMTSAHGILKLLGDLPVAVVQAGTYCHALSSNAHAMAQPFTFTQYAAVFSGQRTELMRNAEASSMDNYQFGAYTAFDISYRAMTRDAQDLLHFISFFHHSNILLAMFAIAAERDFVDPATLLPRPEDHTTTIASLESLLCTDGRWNEIRTHQTIRKLRSFSLITASSFSNMVFLHLHPLVHSWARDRLPSDPQRYREMATQVLTCCSTPANPLLLQYLLPHVQVSLNGNPTIDLHVNDKVAFGITLNYRSCCDEAEALFQQTVEQLRSAGKGHTAEVRLVESLLLATYQNAGKWSDAEVLGLQLLERMRSEVGKDDPESIKVANSLAMTYRSQGRYAEADELMAELFVQQFRLFGEDDNINAAILHNLAATLHSQGRYTEAEELMMVALMRQRELRGIEHPETIAMVGNMIVIQTALGRYSQAEEQQLAVLKQQKRLLGKDHTQTIRAASNLASIYGLQGRDKEAEELELEALEQHRRLLGESHPDTLLIASKLSLTQKRLGRHTQAAELILNVLQQRRSALGDEHPDTLESANNLASTYNRMGRHKEAEELQLETLEQHHRLLGKNHPGTCKATENLALIYGSQGRYEEAEKLLVEVLEHQLKALGEEHPAIVDTANSLACIYSSQGKEKEAEELHVKGLELSRKTQGNEHPSTIVAIANLSTCYYNQGEWEKAEPLLIEVVNASLHAPSLGKEHPDTQSRLSALANVLTKLGKFDDLEEIASFLL